ncbi:MAG: phosphatidylserine decarboxylase [Candidatus Zixiibacteriota bacterium]
MKFSKIGNFRILRKGLILSYAILAGAIIISMRFAPYGIIAGVFFGLLSAIVFWFYRHPHRNSDASENTVISPADGQIVEISYIEDDFVGDSIRIGIFMDVFDVHVNRAIFDCQYLRGEYTKGKFLRASMNKAPFVNEQMHHFFNTRKGRMKIIQIAGLLAQRIDSILKPGDRLKRGDVIGMIQFGSRVDIVIPDDAKALVKIGDKVKAGESEMAVFNG